MVHVAQRIDDRQFHAQRPYIYEALIMSFSNHATCQRAKTGQADKIVLKYDPSVVSLIHDPVVLI